MICRFAFFLICSYHFYKFLPLPQLKLLQFIEFFFCQIFDCLCLFVLFHLQIPIQKTTTRTQKLTKWPTTKQCTAAPRQLPLAVAVVKDRTTPSTVLSAYMAHLRPITTPTGQWLALLRLLRLSRRCRLPFTTNQLVQPATIRLHLIGLDRTAMWMVAMVTTVTKTLTRTHSSALRQVRHALDMVQCEPLYLITALTTKAQWIQNFNPSQKPHTLICTLYILLCTLLIFQWHGHVFLSISTALKCVKYYYIL